MQVVHELELTDIHGDRRSLLLCVGDATEPSASGPVDLLGLSCFRDSYVPTRGTIVRALQTRGISVREAAWNKARDWRATWFTWISHPLPEGPFRYLACFEHEPTWMASLRNETLIEAPDVVGNVFRAVSEFVLEIGVREFGTFRLPLLSTGPQGADKSTMLDAILRHAYGHLRAGLPVRRVEVVLHDREPSIHALLLEAGRTLERVHHEWRLSRLATEPEFDYFVSYRRADSAFKDQLLRSLHAARPGVRVFVDQENLQHGVVWKPEVIGSIYNARRALCIVTDSYAESGECIDEFHVALCCSQRRQGFLRPLLRLASRTIESLPATFRRVNLIDANCPPRQMEQVVQEVLRP